MLYLYLLLKTLTTAVLLFRNEELKNNPQNINENILVKLSSNLGIFGRREMSLFKEHDKLIRYSHKMFFFE
jgi:hypothetical protein